MTDTDALLALASTVKDTFTFEDLPADQPVPYGVLHPGAANPYDRALCGTTPLRASTHRLIAVSNFEDGARTLADLFVDAIDGKHHERSPWFVMFVSDPLEDKSDPSAIRWSCTLEIRHHTIRS